jgi:hypothetical protein
MGRQKPVSCKVCGAKEADGVYISWYGYCPEHGELVQILNIEGMRTGTGPFYEHWLRRAYLANVKRLKSLETTTS